jgi:L-lactate dehydrogenase (cytochrome)
LSKKLDRCRNIADLRELARQHLPAPVFDFLDGGSDDECTARRNSEAFEDYDLLPRALVDVATIDTSTQVLGQRIGLPILISPTGGSRFFHHHGEKAVARAAARAGTFYSLATFGTASIEDVARVAEGPKMFQLYVMRDKGLNAELIRRAQAAAYAALCITVDCPVAGNRERDRTSGLASRPRRLTSKSMLDVLARPAWLWHYMKNPHFLPASLIEHVEQNGTTEDAVAKFVQSQLSSSVTWKDAESLRQLWKGPFAIKGILNVEDAKRAAEIGATAIIVSNHGGRQLDGTIPSVKALPRIVEAVGDRAEVILDGGVRRGTHVLKALALGAKACMIGRPYLYGLAAAGESGVNRVFDILRREVETSMALLGCPNVHAIDRHYIQPHRPG